MDYKFKKSIAPVKKVTAIQFGVLSPEYIKNVSVTQTTYDENGKEIPSGLFETNNIYDPVTKRPTTGAVNDLRMGNTYDLENPGYFGHIELAKPVYHYGFLNTVVDILRCVSFYTSELLISEKDLKNIPKHLKGKKRLKEILKQVNKVKVCKTTKRPLPSYIKDCLNVVVDHTDPEFPSGRRTFSAQLALEILQKISDEDCITLGFNPKYARPEWFLISIVLVPPPHVRPTVSMSSSQKCEDDLTSKLNDIIKSNKALADEIEMNSEPHKIELAEALLQYNVATFFNNKIPNQPQAVQRSGKPLKTISQRLIGKEGRVRGNLMGKRVDFSARTVITADPNLSIDEVGVPRKIAMNLTVPETVNEYNIGKMQQFVDNGPNTHPGAKYIIKDGGKKIDLRYAKKRHLLRPGWTVERHLKDGDLVLFNRQPSLHKMSMMGHRVKVLEHSTFRMNLAVTTPYNADFDGDEMNIHVPQSITAKAETDNLISVNQLIVSPQSNRPVIGIIQDALLASARMTRRGTFVDRKLAMNTLMRINDYKDSDMETPVIPDPCLMVNINSRFKEDGEDVLTTFKVDEIKKTNFENIIRIKASSSDVQIETDIPSKFLKLNEGKEFHMTFSNKVTQEKLNSFDLCMNGTVFKKDGDKVFISYGGLLMKTNGLQDLDKGDKISFLIRIDDMENESKINDESLIHDKFSSKTDESLIHDKFSSKIYPLWSGKQIFSLVIPNEINMRKKSNGSPDEDDDMTETDTRVLIEGGELLSGIIDKKTVGISDGGIIHVLFNDLGPERTKMFLNLVQQVANYWILNNSFSIGVGDTIANENTIQEVNKILENVKKEVKKLSKNTEMHPEKLEKYINAELNSARDEAGKMAQLNLSQNNNFKATVTAGSKGNTLNISQIAAAVGQQNIEGKRVAYGFRDRTLPHYEKNDIKEDSRGFVKNSYLKGLGPQEYFFHHMAGREGLIDTACKSVTGDTQVVIMENGKTKCVDIGSWIDEKMDNNKDKIEYFTKQLDTEMLDIDDIDIFVPTTDKLGNTSWGKITALTRHDPTDIMYEVTTLGGRKVKVTESNSLIVWNEKTKIFEKTLTSKVNIGNFLPTTISLPEPPVIEKFISISKLENNNDDDNWTLDNLELDYESGKFFGILYSNDAFNYGKNDKEFLFIEDDNENECPERMFLLKWLKKYNIYYEHPCNRFAGSCIQSDFTGLKSKRFTNFLFKYTEKNRYNSINFTTIPDEFYGANIDFIKGFVDSIFYDIDDKKNTSVFESDNKTLLEGISYMCSILGIFSKIYKNNITKYDHYPFPHQNDVVLDKIISIDKIDYKNKVYDFTVPETGNFNIFNGLGVKNTSKTGYLQRRLVKALEDMSVRYDGTVRDGRNNILQFLYGEDGMDATHIENQFFDIHDYNNEKFSQIYEHKKATGKGSRLINKLCSEEFEQLKIDQDKLREIMIYKNFNKPSEKFIPIPVNLKRILWNASKLFYRFKVKNFIY